MPLRVPSAQCLKALRTIPRITPRGIQTIRHESKASGIFVKRISPIESPQTRLEELKHEGVTDLYPRYSRPPEKTPALRIQEFNVKYLACQNNQVYEDVTVTIHGRVRNIRALSNKLWFFDLEENGFRLQVIANRRLLEGFETSFKRLHQRVRKGDIISVSGHPGRSNTGQLSLFSMTPPEILTPCLHDLPSVVPPSKAIHHRHLELLSNPVAVKTLRLRSHITQGIRNFLLSHNFVEVETPIIASHASGATAKPFLTNHSSFGDKPLALRIAPELWLKRLVVGGLDRVFEIGPQFRNEHIDPTHNPEFTTCEFYRTYADLDHLITFTEELFQSLSIKVHKAKVEGNDCFGIPETMMDFTPPFNQISFVPKLEELLGEPLPELDNRPEAEIVADLLKFFHKHEIPVPPTPTPAKLLDKLAGHFLEPLCDSPTFITHHPECLSPLSKSAVINGRRIALRAELFVNGSEVVNCYEEENSPVEQRRKFLAQQMTKRSKAAAEASEASESEVAEEVKTIAELTGSDEEMVIDEGYVKALEYGLPPTVGWGCGIDRLVMLFTGQERISGVLSFGGLRGAVNQGYDGTSEEGPVDEKIKLLEEDRVRREAGVEK